MRSLTDKAHGLGRMEINMLENILIRNDMAKEHTIMPVAADMRVTGQMAKNMVKGHSIGPMVILKNQIGKTAQKKDLQDTIFLKMIICKGIMLTEKRKANGNATQMDDTRKPEHIKTESEQKPKTTNYNFYRKMRQKILLTFITLMLATPIFGQSNYTKRVAILETIDKEGQIPYAVKLMIRSNLAQAITATSEYEGYTRVDVASIMDEQEFQRTGLVDDSQIKKLGEMAGADYILISEAVMLNEQSIFIVAKILNVESAQIEKTINVESATTATELQKMCRTMAEDLFEDKTKLFSYVENNRKVAILEIVNRADDLDYGVKFMIRNNISWAITSTPGYEGYDRVDLSSIMQEHDFQRTGLVSDSQIKKLGEMTGAEYILIVEVARIDNQTLFLTANILDVETAKIEKSANAQSGILHSEIKDVSVLLAKELLGWQDMGDGVIATNEMSAEEFYDNGLIADRAKNYELSFKLFDRAAKMGKIDAYYYLGICYESGRGTEQNYTKARACYEKIYQHRKIGTFIPRIINCVIGEYNYLNENSDYDFETIIFKAINYLKNYEKYANVKYHIGHFYYIFLIPNGYRKYEKNKKFLTEMFQYFKESAEQGNKKAAEYLALCYEEGYGVKKNMQQYKYWHQKSKE